MKTKVGKIGTGVGFSRTSGEIKEVVERLHSNEDVGKTFTDNFGREYTYTKQGLIY
jgi:hypothetical protein